MNTKSGSGPTFRVSRVASILAFGIMVLGLGLRLRQYLTNRSLWYDEALLALNLVNHSLPELTQPLDHSQAAPVGFLTIEKLLLQALGNSDSILRLLPLLAGCASLFLMYRLAKHCLSAADSLVALTFFAVSGPSIYYSSELKQFAVDVVVALLLYLLAVRYLARDAALKDYVFLGFIGAVSVWFSHPAAFVLGGIGLALLLPLIRMRDIDGLKNLGLTFGLWATSFCVLYVISLRYLASNGVLLDYWQSAFMPMPPWNDAHWFVRALEGLLERSVGLAAQNLIGLAIFAVGIASLLRRKHQPATMLVAPLLLALLASGIRKYPFSDRLMLFAVPSFLILLGEGLARIRHALRRVPWLSWSVWAVLVGYLMFAPVHSAYHQWRNPDLREHIKPALAFLQARARPNDMIYVYYGAVPALEYYAPFYELDPGDLILAEPARKNLDYMFAELDALRGHDRVWVLFSHVYDWEAIDERALMVQHLAESGQQIDVFSLPPVSVHLYDLDPER